MHAQDAGDLSRRRQIGYYYNEFGRRFNAFARCSGSNTLGAIEDKRNEFASRRSPAKVCTWQNCALIKGPGAAGTNHLLGHSISASKHSPFSKERRLSNNRKESAGADQEGWRGNGIAAVMPKAMTTAPEEPTQLTKAPGLADAPQSNEASECARCAALLAQLSELREARDATQRQLAEERARINALRLSYPPLLYSVAPSPEYRPTERPLRYAVADKVNDLLKERLGFLHRKVKKAIALTQRTPGSAQRES